MRYALLALAIVAALLLEAPAVQAYEGTYTKAQRQTCKFKRNDRWSNMESRDVERCVSSKVDGVSTSKMLDVAECESHHNAYAVSDSGTFKGLFQQHEDYWPGRLRNAQRAARRILGDGLQPSVFNARSNAFVSAWMVHLNGWGDWGCA